MNYTNVATRLVNAINARRKNIGLEDNAPGKLLMATDSQAFEDWINASPDNSARIALGARCALFQHDVVESLPDELDEDQVFSEDGVNFAFIVDRLDDEAWQRKKF